MAVLGAEFGIWCSSGTPDRIGAVEQDTGALAEKTGLDVTRRRARARRMPRRRDPLHRHRGGARSGGHRARRLRGHYTARA